jgi:hypothetical protein
MHTYGNETNEFVNIRDLITDCVAAMCRFNILPAQASKEVVVKEVSETIGITLASNSIGADIAFGTYKHYNH